MEKRFFLAAVVLVAFLAGSQLIGRQSFGPVRTIGVAEMANLLAETLTEVKVQAPLDFNLTFVYAELQLSIGRMEMRDTEATVVILGGSSGTSVKDVSNVTMRVDPAGGAVSASAKDLAELVLVSAQQAAEAVEPDLRLTRVELDYEITTVDEFGVKLELSAGDVALKSAKGVELEGKNAIKIVFNR